MKKIKLYIATSLDGFIAREDGNLDWLTSIPNPSKTDHEYGKFIQGIDEVIMGRKTYDEVLGFDVPWPYEGKSWIISRQESIKIDSPNTYLLNGDWVAKVKEMQQEEGKGIWLIGGGELITAFLDEELIDEMILSMIPVVLGSGLPLFPGKPKETYFKLIDSKQFDSGIVNLSYRKASWI